MKHLILFLIVVPFFLIGCGGSNSSDPHTFDEDAEEIALEREVPVALNNQINSIAEKYSIVKDALVEDDNQRVTNILGSLEGAVEALDHSIPEEEYETIRLQNIKNDMLASTQRMIASQDISTRRKHFEDLSKQMYMLLTEFGVNSMTVYKQYCPMAFDNKGAFWLSFDEEVFNPYFGSEMLRCGYVEEKIVFK